jgi:hypothetical protein
MTMISLSDKIAGLRGFLVHAALFGAVVTVGFAGLLTIDRQLTCAGLMASATPVFTGTSCSQGAWSGDDTILRELQATNL